MSKLAGYFISTHAPLTRCDEILTSKIPTVSISTHAPLTRCDIICHQYVLSLVSFLLTHLLRGATKYPVTTGYLLYDFYSRTSYEVRRSFEFKSNWLSIFLLTHLLRGATLSRRGTQWDSTGFLLTHLLRGATLYKAYRKTRCGISTHAPLTRCDRGSP